MVAFRVSPTWVWMATTLLDLFQVNLDNFKVPTHSPQHPTTWSVLSWVHWVCNVRQNMLSTMQFQFRIMPLCHQCCNWSLLLLLLLLLGWYQSCSNCIWGTSTIIHLEFQHRWGISQTLCGWILGVVGWLEPCLLSLVTFEIWTACFSSWTIWQVLFQLWLEICWTWSRWTCLTTTSVEKYLLPWSISKNLSFWAWWAISLKARFLRSLATSPIYR